MLPPGRRGIQSPAQLSPESRLNGEMRRWPSLDKNDSLANRLLLRLPLDGSTLTGTADTGSFADVSGNGRVAIASADSPPKVLVKGWIGQGVQFAAPINGLAVTGLASTTGQMSVALWFNPGVLTRGDLVAIWTDGTGNSQFNLLYGLTSGKPQFFITGGGSATSSGASTTTMVVGQWYHIAGTYDGATVSLYINGALEASASSAIVLGSGSGIDFRIGNNAAFNGAVTGTEDEVWFSDRAWTPAEVARMAGDITGNLALNVPVRPFFGNAAPPPPPPPPPPAAGRPWLLPLLGGAIASRATQDALRDPRRRSRRSLILPGARE